MTEAQTATTDLLIAGAGMTGLALALALADEGMSVELVDPQPRDLKALDAQLAQMLSELPDVRVSALTLASEQLLRNLDVWQEIKEWRAQPYRRMHVWDGETRGEISFDAAELHEPYLGYIVENGLIVAALLKRAVEHPDIRLSFGLKIESLTLSDGVQHCQLSDGSERNCSLVVAADGAVSATRRLAGVGTHEWDYGQHALVATLRLDRSHQHCCWQRFTEDGPLALLPLKSEANDLVSLVWSTSPEHAQELLALSSDELAGAVTRGSSSRAGEVLEVTGAQVIPLRQRYAQQYVKSGIALVGDAAHTIHPLAGQGVNLGFQDVAALVETLLQGRNRCESIASERVLRRYQRRRMLANLRMSAAMQGFKTLFTPQPPLVELARSLGMRAVDQCSPVKQHLMLEAMGLRGDLPALQKRPIII